MHEIHDPITYRQVLEYIEQSSSTDEALRFLAGLRDRRLARMSQIFEQTSRALDFLTMQIHTDQFKEDWYEEEVHKWIEKQNHDYQTLSDEQNALQAGIDRLLSSGAKR